MDFLTLFILLAAFLIIAWLIKLFFFTKPKKQNVHHEEIKALNHILAGEEETALRLLKEIGHKDTSNLGVYLQVGDLYRQLGDAETAVKVHTDVLSRDNLNSDTQRICHERLAMDYEELGKYQLALQQAEAILKLDRKNLWALQAIHRFEAKQKNWSAAIKAHQKEIAAGGDADPLLPAVYKTEEAIAAKVSGDISAAVSLLKQAIKLNSQCPAPFYHLGKIRQEEGNFKHAIDFYTTFVELDPTAGSLVFAEIEKMYFELGQFEQVEQFYERQHKKQPDNLEIIVGLARYFERKGEYKDALNLLEEVKDPDYANLSVILGHIHMLNKLGHKDGVKLTIEKLIAADRQKRILTCPNCGHSTEEPSYLCQKCGWVKFNS